MLKTNPRAMTQLAGLCIAATAFETQQAFCAITGYSVTEAQGQNPRLLQSGSNEAVAPVEYARAATKTIAFMSRQGKLPVSAERA
jgi:hypothetical protein